MMIVIDYDAGNTANVLRALKSIGVEAVLSARSLSFCNGGVGKTPTHPSH